MWKRSKLHVAEDLDVEEEGDVEVESDFAEDHDVDRENGEEDCDVEVEHGA